MEWIVFLPSILALILAFVFKNAFWALATGSLAGAVVYNWDSLGQLPVYIYKIFIGNHVFNSWKMGAFLLTLQLGALAALLDKNKNIEKIFDLLSPERGHKKKSLTVLSAMGIACFYDGLANSILLGRLSLRLKKRFPVSNEKLAYIVDSTSSSVACLVVFSTWTAYQISLIATAIENTVLNGRSLEVLVKSIPYNFYSILTLVFVFAVAGLGINLGPMRGSEEQAEKEFDSGQEKLSASRPEIEDHGVVRLVLPVLLLFFSFLAFVSLYATLSNTDKGFFQAFIKSLSSGHTPWLLNLSACFSWLCLLILRDKKLLSAKAALVVSWKGLIEIFRPCLILFGAWAISSVISDLGAGKVIADIFLKFNVGAGMLPLAVFFVSCVIAFFTGTSWGTLALMVPLAVPVAVGFGVDTVSMAVGAVFGGAVFGDHCSPLSDTSIVSAFATNCELKGHVKTQIPYALSVAVVSGLGYVAFGFFV